MLHSVLVLVVFLHPEARELRQWAHCASAAEEDRVVPKCQTEKKKAADRPRTRHGPFRVGPPSRIIRFTCDEYTILDIITRVPSEKGKNQFNACV